MMGMNGPGKSATVGFVQEYGLVEFPKFRLEGLIRSDLKCVLVGAVHSRCDGRDFCMFDVVCRIEKLIIHPAQ